MNTLKLDRAQGLMRKISNNLLNFGADKITAFTLPIEGIVLEQAALDELLGEYTHRSWFDQRPDGSWHPMPWWAAREKRDFHLSAEFDCAAVTIIVSGDRVLEFEREEGGAQGGEDDGEDGAGARISRLVLTPQAGGTTLLAFHLQVRPGLDRENLLLQEHQFRHVTITLGDVTLSKRAGAEQQSLPLETAGQQQQPDGEGPRPVSGGFVQTKSAEELDAEMRARHPETPLMGDAASPGFEDPASDLRQFEEGARAQVAAATAAPGDLIDGRSERVKQADRQRGRRRSAETH